MLGNLSAPALSATPKLCESSPKVGSEFQRGYAKGVRQLWHVKTTWYATRVHRCILQSNNFGDCSVSTTCPTDATLECPLHSPLGSLACMPHHARECGMRMTSLQLMLTVWRYPSYIRPCLLIRPEPLCHLCSIDVMNWLESSKFLKFEKGKRRML